MTHRNEKPRAPHETGPRRPRQAPRIVASDATDRPVPPRLAAPRPETASEIARARGGPPRPRGVR